MLLFPQGVHRSRKLGSQKKKKTAEKQKGRENERDGRHVGMTLVIDFHHGWFRSPFPRPHVAEMNEAGRREENGT